MNADFDEFYNNFIIERNSCIEYIKKLGASEKLKVKKTGFLADNIWIIDFSNSDSFEKSQKIFSSYTVPESVQQIKFYKKTNRVVFMF